MTGWGGFDSSGNFFAAQNNYRYNGLGHRIMEQWDEDASDVLDADERLYYVHDSRWRQVAVYREQDANPKEAFIYHAAGLAGSGSSSYIDSVILRDRDNTSCGTGCDPWLASSDGVLEQRRYYVQNWRADVTALLKSTGEPVEWIRYTAYGTPTVHPIADINGDGSVTSADYTAWTDLYNNGISTTAVFLNPDLNRDDVYPNQDDDDYFVEQYNLTVAKASGFDQLSTLGNRKGYAGYERDESLTMWHVRHRVLDSKSGKWTRKDPLGYVDGVSDVEYVRSGPARYNDASGLILGAWCWSERSRVGVSPAAPVEPMFEEAFPPIFVYVCCRRIWRLGLPTPFLHCEPRSTCLTGEQSSPVFPTTAGQMDNGLPCRCATRNDVEDCMERNPYDVRDDLPGIQDGGGRPGNNCQTNTRKRFAKCCLETSWVPQYIADPPGIKPPDREIAPWGSPRRCM
jgi:RHS repeat-associated protein